MTNTIEEIIQREYEKRGHQAGWRFLYSPKSVLDSADVAFIGLNPGGSHADPTQGMFSTEGGSAYEIERWYNGRRFMPKGQSRLQLQVRCLFERLNVSPEAVLAGNLIPFRSENRDRLSSLREANAFGLAIWVPILNRLKPSLVIAMGRGDVGLPLMKALKAKGREDVSLSRTWTGTDATTADLDYGRLVVLPHLSRFPMITRPESQGGLRAIFGDRWRSPTG